MAKFSSWKKCYQSMSLKTGSINDSDTVSSISGRNVIMAYGGHPYYYIQRRKGKPVCNCLFWYRYLLFILNFFIWAAGGTIIGLGTWIHISGADFELFKSLLTVPTWLLIGTGIGMFSTGVFGCVGTFRQSICYLCTFMVLLIVVLVVQVLTGIVLYLLMDDIHSQMMDIVKSSVISYHVDNSPDRDKNLDYLQHQFSCCGGSSYMDWEANTQYNCSGGTASSKCGVPSSCCRGTQDEQCGHKIREGTKGYSDMFAYTEGCVGTLMGIFKENIIFIAAVVSSVCFLEILCLVLSSLISRHIIHHRKLEL